MSKVYRCPGQKAERASFRLQIMPKLYLGPGLSSRVHQALCRRLEQFMAANAEAAGQREASEFPRTENPPLPGNADVNESEGGKEDDHGSPPPPEDFSKSPVEKGDDDRSRSPRRIPEVSVQSTNELLASTTSLAVGMTSMVGALKDATNKMEAVLQQSQSLQRDLCRSLARVKIEPGPSSPKAKKKKEEAQDPLKLLHKVEKLVLMNDALRVGNRLRAGIMARQNLEADASLDLLVLNAGNFPE